MLHFFPRQRCFHLWCVVLLLQSLADIGSSDASANNATHDKLLAQRRLGLSTVFRHYYLKDYLEVFGVWPLDVMVVDNELTKVYDFPEDVITTVSADGDLEGYMESVEDYGDQIKKWVSESTYTQSYFEQTLTDGDTSIIADHDTADERFAIRDERIYVRWVSPTMGYGCFARTAFKEKELVAVFGGIITHRTYNTDYAWKYQAFLDFKDKKGNEIPLLLDSLRAGNALRFVNHDPENIHNINQYYVPIGRLWYNIYVAKRDIEPHEELYVNYGGDYWSTRDH